MMTQRATRPAMEAARPPARATSARAVTVVAALLPWTCRPFWLATAAPSCVGSRCTVSQVWVVVPNTASARAAITRTRVDLRAQPGTAGRVAVLTVASGSPIRNQPWRQQLPPGTEPASGTESAVMLCSELAVCTARSGAAALLTVSWASVGLTESATIPPPAWT